LSSILSNNSAEKGGAIALRRSAGTEGREGVTVSGSEFLENHAGLSGGAIESEGERTAFFIADTDFSRNAASSRAGAIQLRDSALDMGYSQFQENLADDCGALENTAGSDLTIRNTEFRDNNTDGSGGGLCHDGDSLEIRNGRFESNQAAIGGGGLYATRPFTLRNSSLEFNQAGEFGGGVYSGDSSTITGSTFTGNTSYVGGGFYGGWLPGETRGTFTTIEISQSTFVDNRATASAGHTEPAGGAIAFFGFQVSVESSTIWRNRADRGAGIYALQYRLDMTNSTVSENIGAEGPGLYLDGTTNLAMLYSSIIDNQADMSSGSVVLSGPLVIESSIINALGASKSCVFLGPGPYNMPFENLDNDGSCGFSMTSHNLYIDRVADNGGPTYTNALLPNSPAIDASGCQANPGYDQRGGLRPSGASCDLGAFELNQNAPPPPPANPTSTPTPGPAPVPSRCVYRAVENANCRAGDDIRTSILAILMQGDPANLLSLDPAHTHGLFELADGRSCWIWLPQMDGPADPANECEVTIVTPPPYVPPEGPACMSDLPEAQCEAAGGTMSGGVTTAPHCVCP
jgi:hypothetical protein